MNIGPSRVILVTGASSGIGNHLSRALAAAGDIASSQPPARSMIWRTLAAIDNVTPVRLDVRDALQVRDAVETVPRAGADSTGWSTTPGAGSSAPAHAGPTRNSSTSST